MKNPLIVILGPTASGKTEVSIELSKLLNIEIISADSRQIFKYLDVGTAKPTKEELSIVKHHFIDIIEPDEYYSAGRFGIEAEAVANEICLQNKIPVVVGGSGLYIRALCEGLFSQVEDIKNFDIRDKLQLQFEKEGIEPLYEELEHYDLPSAKMYSDKNPRRIIRALEYWYSTGIPISEAYKTIIPVKNFNILYFGINLERDLLYSRINQRSEKMWDSGLPEEMESILKMGYSPALNSLNSVGYKECIDFLNGKLSKAIAIDLTKQNTRRYAKRQMTWFRKNEKITWLSGNSREIAGEIYKVFMEMKDG